MQRASAPRSTPWDNDQILTAVIGALALGTVVGSVGLFWDKTVTWLVGAQVLVTAEQEPIWALPASGGAGLDWSRLTILLGAGLVLVALTASAARRSWTKREPAE